MGAGKAAGDACTGDLCIGAVVPHTGRLAALGDPLSYVIGRLGSRLPAVADGARRRRLRIVCRDSRSDPAVARRVTRELAERDGVRLVVTMAGTKVLPAVADACEELGVPCLSTTFPWQAYVYGRGATRKRPFGWTYHFAWGLDDIADVFAEMWERIGPGRKVGCLWNDDLQGRLLRDGDHGFVPTAAGRGHTLVDPGGYREAAGDLSAHVDRFRDRGCEIVTSAATAEDLALFHRQARERGLRPRLVTCSRWLAYPRGGGIASALGGAGVATLVYWSPRHPYRSSLDGTSARALADAYEQQTGRPWLQPLGLAHALLEVAAHALATAEDPTDRRSVADAIGRTRLPTMAGTLDWTNGPTPNVALIPLIGGQWQQGRNRPHELALVTHTRLPQVPLDADLTPAY
ncbi:ABC transporter substrate-binding protein [Streptomyces chattanoogensis]|uniref:ABC transporter substrate-binding protein n=1 Tax=Streptomyces chattanoogensis TaxID=66876 RepID=UPI00368770B5